MATPSSVTAIGNVRGPTLIPPARRSRTVPPRSVPWFSRWVPYVVTAAILMPGIAGTNWLSRFSFPLVAILIACAVERTQRSSARMYAVIFAFYLAIISLAIPVAYVLYAGGSRLGPGTTLTYLVLAPAAFMLGMRIWDSGRVQAYGRAFLLLSLATVPLAIYEAVTRTKIFPLEDVINPARALVGQEHPITLALLLASAIFTATGLTVGLRLIVSVVLILGIVATGSSGPLAVGIVAAIATVTGLSARAPAARRYVGLLVTAAAIVGTYLSVLVFTPVMADTNIDEYSNQYRGAIYSLLPRILAEAPLGYGVDGLPENMWTVWSNYRGIRDISISADSEFVFVAGKFGWIGLALLGVGIVIAVLALRSAPVPALMLLSVFACGVFVALHAWPSIAAFGFILLGICVRSLRAGNRRIVPARRSARGRILPV